jgi:hypothetical protein
MMLFIRLQTAKFFVPKSSRAVYSFDAAQVDKENAIRLDDIGKLCLGPLEEDVPTKKQHERNRGRQSHLTDVRSS